MPKFRCLGKEFSINATDLERAPDSVLAEAWKTGDHHTDSVVELGAWPEPDLESLEVRACRPVPHNHVVRLQAEPLPVQLILARLRREPYNAGRPINKAKALKALDYFGVPEALWPHGLQLLRRAQQSFTLWQERDQQAIKEIVQQICSQMAVPSVENYPRPRCDKVEAVSHHMDFEATKYDPLTGLYTLVVNRGGSVGVPPLPQAVKAGVVALGKQECLAIAIAEAPLSFGSRDTSRITFQVQAAMPDFA